MTLADTRAGVLGGVDERLDDRALANEQVTSCSASASRSVLERPGVNRSPAEPAWQSPVAPCTVLCPRVVTVAALGVTGVEETAQTSVYRADTRNDQIAHHERRHDRAVVLTIGVHLGIPHSSPVKQIRAR